MSWGWIPLIWGLVILLVAMLLQLKTKHFIRALQTDEALYRQAGSPTRDYFWLGLLCHRNQHLLSWVGRHAVLPVHLAEAVPDYAQIRQLCRLLRWLEWGFVGYLVAHFLLLLLQHIYQ
ncbi:MAG: hypothetical protein KBC57_04035 [Neisseriaceae bacterium]|nr:hypothetical protein [Neisseriaceae bacterium]